jgi:hypothetical protein
MNLIVDSRRCIIKGLLQVLLFQERVFSKDLLTLMVGGQNLQHPANGDPHSTNAGFARALSGFDGDAVKGWNLGHVFILLRFSQWRATNRYQHCIHCNCGR